MYIIVFYPSSFAVVISRSFCFHLARMSKNIHAQNLSSKKGFFISTLSFISHHHFCTKFKSFYQLCQACFWVTNMSCRLFTKTVDAPIVIHLNCLSKNHKSFQFNPIEIYFHNFFKEILQPYSAINFLWILWHHETRLTHSLTFAVTHTDSINFCWCDFGFQNHSSNDLISCSQLRSNQALRAELKSEFNHWKVSDL